MAGVTNVSGGGGGTNGVRGSVIPPPFLTKLYTMLNDPNTDYLISWGLSGTSLIIWDHIRFSAELLPAYFKHSNFSSFMYQLNNYGFRKIGVNHQWEYENPHFQAGNTSALANIKRRDQNSQPGLPRRRRRRRGPPDSSNYDRVKVRLDILRNQINESKLEISNLKSQQAEIEFQIAASEEDIKNSEIKSEEVIALFAKACDDILVRKKNYETKKKRKLDTPESSVDNPDVTESENVDGKSGEEDEPREKVIIQDSENKADMAISNAARRIEPDGEICVKLEKPEMMEKKGTAEDSKYWEQMIMVSDDEVCENDDGAGSDQTMMQKQRAEIAAELECLIAKFPDQDIKPTVLLHINLNQVSRSEPSKEI